MLATGRRRAAVSSTNQWPNEHNSKPKTKNRWDVSPQREAQQKRRCVKTKGGNPENTRVKGKGNVVRGGTKIRKCRGFRKRVNKTTKP